MKESLLDITANSADTDCEERHVNRYGSPIACRSSGDGVVQAIGAIFHITENAPIACTPTKTCGCRWLFKRDNLGISQQCKLPLKTTLGTCQKLAGWLGVGGGVEIFIEAMKSTKGIKMSWPSLGIDSKIL